MNKELNMLLTLLVKNAGGLFQGIQPSFKNHPALVLLTDPTLPPKLQSTVAIPLEELSSERVKAELQELRIRMVPA